MWLWQFVTSDFFTSHLKRVVSNDPIRIQDLKAKDHTFFLHALLFSVSAWFCLFHGQIKDSREWSLAKDLSASSAWHAKYWAHQVSKRWEDTSTSLFMDGKLPAPPLWGSRGRNSCYICFQSPMRPTVPLGWKRPIILQLHQIKLPVAYS